MKDGEYGSFLDRYRCVLGQTEEARLAESGSESAVNSTSSGFHNEFQGTVDK